MEETQEEKPCVGNNEIDKVKDNMKCGFAGWSPDWLQKLASKKIYLIILGFIGLNSSAVAAYFSGTLSTLEKRFKFPSAKSGFLASSFDFAVPFATMLVAYYGGKGHKTRWLAIFSLLTSISCLLMVVPHVIYGPGESSLEINTRNIQLCNASNVQNETCDLNSEGKYAYTIFLIGYSIQGLSSVGYCTIGAAYLDDNISKDKFPFLIGLLSAIKYTGPLLGFTVASYALSQHINPKVQPEYTEEDPRWIGSWYLGWIIFAIIELLLAFGMSFFPKILPRQVDRMMKINKTQISVKKNTKKGFINAVIRILKNPIIMLNTISFIFLSLGRSPFWLFLPKYIETQFRQPASKASMITGSMRVVFTVVGALASGAFISVFKPKAKYLAAWNIFTETLEVISRLMFLSLGCHIGDFHGTLSNGRWDLAQECNAHCDCSQAKTYSPICSIDEKTAFYSPCHAGCTDFDEFNSTMIFSNCSCIKGFQNATAGLCLIDCDIDFYLFLMTLGALTVLMTSGQAGNTVIQFRSVDPQDKALAIAFTNTLIACFAIIPAPILFGYLLDIACFVWEQNCGSAMNCWVYDTYQMRILLQLTSAVLLAIGTFLDIGVYFKVGSLEIYEQEKTPDDSKIEPADETELSLMENK